MLISVHIPKTAGSSFREALQENFADRLYLDYTDRPLSTNTKDHLRRFSNKCKLRAFRGRFQKQYDAAHGHFIADKYAFLGGDARHAVFFRDPVDRVISHYRHRMRNPSPIDPVNKLLHDDHMPVEAFSELPSQQNLYATFLGNMPVEKFDFVGLTEEYGKSLKLAEEIFAIQMPHFEGNVGGGKPGESAADIDRKRMATAQLQNQRIYDQARQKFDQLCKLYQIT
jgi:Sulfotransferase family